MLAQKLMGSVGGASDKLYVDDVFSTYLYTGNSSTQTINNGIDLAGKGGLVWSKTRSGAAWAHILVDTMRGGALYLESNTTTYQQSAAAVISSFDSNGFTLAPDSFGLANYSGIKYASWTFRKAPKFFDVVTYTGNGVSGRYIPHSLGIAPGMVIVKCASTSGDWSVQARMTSNSAAYLKLNSSGSASSVWNGETLSLGTPTVFYVGSGGTTDTNINGATYVAYLFAHDPSADGIIQCGGVTSTAGGAIPAVNLGWEPQYILYKNSGAAWNWEIWDSSRNWSVASTGNATANALKPNLADAETGGNTAFTPTATGFYSNTNFGASQTFIYLAIRRPNKPPTTGTEVYNAIARTGTGAATTVTGVGFAPDLAIWKARTAIATGGRSIQDRLRGAGRSLTSTGTADENVTDVGYGLTGFDSMDGIRVGKGENGYWNYGGSVDINHFFKRAPGFFDVVCYTGTGVTKTEAHGLGAVPELIIVKGRSATTQWVVYSSALGATKYLSLNSTAAEDIFSGFWDNVTPTSSVFTVGTGIAVNQNSQTHVAYLFATKVGISKVGNYTGNGGTQTIACGFATGARFILIKRTDSTGDWYVWDTARGIIAANDPHLSLNTTAAEVTTDDSVDPTNEGFIVNNVSPTNINVNAGSYTFLAIS